MSFLLLLLFLLSLSLLLLFYQFQCHILSFLLSRVKERAAHGEIKGNPFAEIDGGPLENQTSVFVHVEQGLRKSPHGAAIICIHQPANHLSDLVPTDYQFGSELQRFECLTWTYTQMHEAALRLATGVMANGIQPNSIVLMLIPNGGEYCLLLWTCIIMRLTYVCIAPSSLSIHESTELRDALETLKPSMVVVPDADGCKTVDFMVEQLRLTPYPLCISLFGKSNPKRWKSLLDLAEDASESPLVGQENNILAEARNDDPDRIHSILFTSGTSGRPKGCPLRVRGMTHVLHSQSWLINKHNCTFALQQAHNSRGIAPAQTLQTWRVGGTVVMTGRGFSANDVIDAISMYHVTFIVLTPPMVHSVGLQLASQPVKVDSVKSIQIGGDTVTKDVLLRCAALFPNASLCVNHGMTEGGGSFTWSFFDVPTHKILFFGEICPIGTVAAGAVIRIWDAGTGSLSRRGRPGELHICCGSIIPHYLGGASESSFYEDKKGRWFKTGDIAIMDDIGLVFILGRSKDMISRNGFAIMPAALESCIEKFTGAQTSVVAIPHTVLGNEPYAVLSSLNGKTKDHIKDHVTCVFGNDYALGGVSSLEQIGLSEFPLNATHKIVKSEVANAVLRHINRAVA